MISWWRILASLLFFFLGCALIFLCALAYPPWPEEFCLDIPTQIALWLSLGIISLANLALAYRVSGLSKK